MKMSTGFHIKYQETTIRRLICGLIRKTSCNIYTFIIQNGQIEFRYDSETQSHHFSPLFYIYTVAPLQPHGTFHAFSYGRKYTISMSQIMPLSIIRNPRIVKKYRLYLLNHVK